MIRGEFDLIRRLTKGLPLKAKDLSRGAGDDCAVISGPDKTDWLVTTDALVEGTHFRREWTDFKTLGRKALAVNLSDIAAMGGTPRFYLVVLGLKGKLDFPNAEAVYRGMKGLAREANVVLVGGDTVKSKNGFLISITAIGEVKKGKAILRSTARAGDVVYVTGSLGGSAMGLFCLENGICDKGAGRFIKRHLSPTTRIQEGKWLGGLGLVASMIDVSDGIVADLSHIADESGVGFELDAAEIPMENGLAAYAGRHRIDARTLALSGGEDYELAFTVRVKDVKRFEGCIGRVPRETRVTRIGRIVASKKMRRILDVKGRGVRVPEKGFDHFK